jgi:hypothetical protein
MPQCFDKMHQSNWRKENLGDFFINKRKLFEEIDDLDRFDLIYFDAFGYRVQPELWSTAIFKNV